MVALVYPSVSEIDSAAWTAFFQSCMTDHFLTLSILFRGFCGVMTPEIVFLRHCNLYKRDIDQDELEEYLCVYKADTSEVYVEDLAIIWTHIWLFY